ncbi:MAG: tRNA threonylcarbamoyladenosine dehydratase [Candidatus Cloacimonetes bacterium]|nr:tRNA threonylcarbamoyladenosine dehydratase [Candidatus Cloacimonadota bacterium]
MSSIKQFSRTEILFGEKAIQHFQKTKVAIMGLGGVGSYAAEALVRSGIGSFLLVDFDVISLTNLNRQLPALHSTIGLMKTEVMQKRMDDINPNVEIEIFNGFFADDSKEKLLEGIDFVVDAIDSLTPKTALLEVVYHKKIPVISSMGAAGRIDPGRIELCDISKTKIDPLARKVRKYLHRRGIFEGIPVIYSSEKPVPQLDFEAGSQEEWIGNRGRERGTLGSVVYLPAIMGLWAASFVLRSISSLKDTER